MPGEASRHAQEITCAVIPANLIIPPWRAGHGRLPDIEARPRLQRMDGCLCGGIQRQIRGGRGSGFSLACQSGTGHTVRSLAGDRGVPRGLRDVAWNADDRRGTAVPQSRNNFLPGRTTAEKFFVI